MLVRKNIKVMLEEISPSKIILCCQCERVHFIAVEPNGNSEFISAYQKIKNKIKMASCLVTDIAVLMIMDN